MSGGKKVYEALTDLIRVKVLQIIFLEVKSIDRRVSSLVPLCSEAIGSFCEGCVVFNLHRQLKAFTMKPRIPVNAVQCLDFLVRDL